MAALRNPHCGTVNEPIKFLVALNDTPKQAYNVWRYRQYISLPFVQHWTYGEHIGRFCLMDAMYALRACVRQDPTLWISFNGQIANWSWHFPELMRPYYNREYNDGSIRVIGANPA